jgi:hypothetical protein
MYTFYSMQYYFSHSASETSFEQFPSEQRNEDSGTEFSFGGMTQPSQSTLHLTIE